MRKFVWIVAAALTIAVAACGPSAPPPLSGGNVPPPVRRERTATPVPATDEDAIKQLIVAEGESVVQQDIDRLQGMWASDGIVTDANRTPANAGDDKTWRGWTAIRDRYVNIVFPSNPAFAEHPNIKVNIAGETASAVADTKIGVTNLKENDRWTFRKIDGQWKITSLTFSLAAQ